MGRGDAQMRMIEEAECVLRDLGFYDVRFVTTN
jgi:hypothetical protein